MIFLIPFILSELLNAYIDRKERDRGSVMDRTRQDAWTEDEDTLLAEIVLENMRHGRTQLEAFKQAGDALLRTAAACGFRWNATVRKKHMEAITRAKNNRKQSMKNISILNE